MAGLRKGSHGEGTWALPGGWLERGESFERCALRELEEETGIGGDAILSCSVSSCPPSNNVMGDVHTVTVFVEVEIAPAAEAALREPAKCTRWDWFAWEAIPEPLFMPLAHAGRHFGAAPTAGAR